MFIAAPKHMRYELLSSTFSSVFTPEEETILAGEIAQGAWNGKTVRLERLLKEADTLTLGLTPSRYFDLLSTNLLVSRDVSGWTPAMQTLAARLKQKAAALSLAEDPLQILSCPFLANDLAVSVLVHDGKGRCLLAERSGAVSIAPRTFSVSVTGALDERDLEAEDPIRSCAARECAEEVGATIPEDAFHPLGIFIGERKLQPIALIEAALPSFESISQNFETRRFLMVPKEELDSFCGLPMSEAARFQLNLFLKREA